MADTTRVKLRVGFADQLRDIEFELPAGEPRPWDATSKLEIVGKPAPRIDGPARVTGAARYTHDIRLPGLLYAAVLRSPHPCATLGALDLGPARNAPGVVAVLALAKAGERLLFAGQDVAAVAARTPQQARAALRQISATFAPEPFVVDTRTAMEADAPIVHRGKVEERSTEGDEPGVAGGATQKGNVRMSPSQKKGDVDRGLRQARVTHEATYSTQVHTHSALETHSLVLRWDSPTTMTAWCSTQGIFSVRDELAEIFELKPQDVRVITDFMGGGFGAKFGASAPGSRLGFIAGELARQAKAPVALLLDRREEHLCTGNRPDSIQQVTLGATADGTSPPSRCSPTAAPASAPAPASAATPSASTRAAPTSASPATTSSPTPAPPPPSAPPATRRAPSPSSSPSTSSPPSSARTRSTCASPTTSTPCAAISSSSAASASAGTSAASRPSTSASATPGCAAASAWPRRSGATSGAARPSSPPSASAATAASRSATACRTSAAASPPSWPRSSPRSCIARSPRSACASATASSAPASAAAAARPPPPSPRPCAPRRRPSSASSMQLASKHFGGKPMRWDNHGVHRVGVTKGSLAFAELCKHIDGEAIVATGTRPETYGAYPMKFMGGNSYQIAGVQFIEVEVDTWTGLVRATEVLALHDCGRVMNELSCRSQVQGGIILGTSYALMEQRVMDTRRGVMLNPNLESYKIAGALDVPNIEVVFTEVHTGANNTGAIGIGEPATIPTAAAIACALFNAIGAPVRDLPLTPDRVLAALGMIPARGD
jgi:xanthine dehydrogenase YagR molybdenum-binding subunit